MIIFLYGSKVFSGSKIIFRFTQRKTPYESALFGEKLMAKSTVTGPTSIKSSVPVPYFSSKRGGVPLGGKIGIHHTDFNWITYLDFFLTLRG